MPRNLGICLTLILLRILYLWHVLAQNETEATLPIAPHCGAPLSNRLTRDLRAEKHEFPWIALIEYHKPDGQAEFLCGGSLINYRYVLTAAHCFELVPSDWEVSGVRLGEWNLAADQDCENDYCTDETVDMGIEKIIIHEDYVRRRTRYNDIALIRLHTAVDRSDSISPVCLPVAEPQRSQGLVNKNGHIAGWGTMGDGTYSYIKLKIPMKITDPAGRCADIHSSGRYGIVIANTQMCAIGLRSQWNICVRLDTRGNPLTIEEYLNDYHTLFNYQYGISSFGSSCDLLRIPEIYTDVTKYIDWIQSKLY